MGLDTVEIILRAEEVFGVDLPDEDCGLVITVGDFYKLILTKLHLPYESAKDVEGTSGQACRGRSRLQSQFPSIRPWNTADTWMTLKAILQAQLAVEDDEVYEDASFLGDLRCD